MNSSRLLGNFLLSTNCEINKNLVACDTPLKFYKEEKYLTCVVLNSSSRQVVGYKIPFLCKEQILKVKN